MYRVLGKDCKAVSGVYGQLLMISLVVLGFSGIALTVFSELTIESSQDMPHIDLQGNINAGYDTVEISHIGGEAVDLSAIKIIFSANGQQTEFNRSEFKVKNPDGNNSIDDALTLGDCIVISPARKGVNLISEDAIDMFVVHTPSRQIIQKAVFQAVSWERPQWITPYPYGSVYDNSTPSGWLPIERVGTIDDGIYTEIPVPKNPASVYEEYEFGIDADEMGISDPLSSTSLIIIYESHDHSNNNLTLSIYNGSAWTQVKSNMKEYHSFDDCKKGNLTYDISPYVKSTDELEKLKVKFLVTGNSKSGKKYLNVDFVGIHVES